MIIRPIIIAADAMPAGRFRTRLAHASRYALTERDMTNDKADTPSPSIYHLCGFSPPKLESFVSLRPDEDHFSDTWHLLMLRADPLIISLHIHCVCALVCQWQRSINTLRTSHHHSLDQNIL